MADAWPAPEPIVARDLARRGLWLAPLFVAASALGWGGAGALSALFALVLVLGNFALSATLSWWAARISLQMLMGTVLIGYLARLALIGVATIAVRNAWWFQAVPWGFTLIIAHLGLLTWEARHVSASLAFPALKPKSARRGALRPATLHAESRKG